MSDEITKLFKSMHSYDNRFDMEKDLKSDLIEKHMYGKLRSRTRFDAYVLQGWNYTDAGGAGVNDSGRYIAAYLRPIELLDFILPPPCPNDVSSANIITSMHPIGISQSPLVGTDTLFNIGDVVSCFWDYKSPAFKGHMRGLRFELGKVRHAAGNYDFACLDKEISKLGFGASSQLGSSERDSATAAGKRGQTKKIDFSTIKYDESEYNCKPADPSAFGKDVVAYFGKKNWEIYKREIGTREGGSKGYRAENAWSYLGMYQINLSSLARFGVISSGAKKKIEEAGCTKQGDKCKAFLKALTRSPGTWRKKHDMPSASLEGFKSAPICQDKAFEHFTNRKFEQVIRLGALKNSENNIANVAGVLAMAHLKGQGGAGLVVTKGINTADANGTFPSRYYVEVGGLMKSNCS